MTVPAALNSGEPARIGAGSDTVTLVEGATSCLSDRHGDTVAGGSQGLFFRHARVLSRWELRVDGQVAESVSVESSEAFAAQCILRRAPHAGLVDSTLLVVRERLVADGRRETVTLSNLGGRGRAFVAAGAPWFMTLFGRDSLLTAWMALPLHVGLPIGTLQQLAAAQV